MNKKLISIFLFLTLILTACNMPAGETASIDDAVRQTQQARQVNNNAQLQPTQQQQNTNNAQPDPAVQPTQQSAQAVAQPTQQNLQPTTAPVVQAPINTPFPTQVPPTATQPPPPTTVSIVTKSGYVELRDWYVTDDLADLDFDGVPQLAYIAATSDYPSHGLGENVAQGNITNMSLVATATYDTCLAINSWDTAVAPVSAGQTYCFVADNNNGTSYGYFHIDKIENQGSEIDNWVIGISYTVWIPASSN